MNKKILVIVTSAFFVLCFGLMIYKKQTILPPKAHIPTNAKHFPTLGNRYAPINITVFEEPSCLACAEFSTEVFPLLKKNYIDTGEVSFTLIPVCFIRGSMPAAQALLCVYHHDPYEPDIEAYMEYFHRLLIHPKEEGKHWATPQVLTKLTENLKTHSGRSINPRGLMQCIDSQRYEEQIKKNNIYGSQVLGGQLATPTAVVGDYLIEDPTFEELERVIRQIRYLQATEEDND
ncbi:thioredoxin domain-containing protein [Chlamydia psittaci]|uniref:DsbA family protein n=2 Tax=Chlamydia/Chlamydophila group TaxID=1113537 RepID=A0ABX5VW60_9CHLA|nr:thioredoxin family protein [Chlamydia psittaci C1/97]QDE36820.1 DsbA family protein [Chlamydophila parapsittaci]QHE18482.1 thioredoxin domain-containing protein [Chlamydia psittaci]